METYCEKIAFRMSNSYRNDPRRKRIMYIKYTVLSLTIPAVVIMNKGEFVPLYDEATTKMLDYLDDEYEIILDEYEARFNKLTNGKYKLFPNRIRGAEETLYPAT